MRILKWVVERARGRAVSTENPLGWMLHYEDIDWRGMENFSREPFHEVIVLWGRSSANSDTH